MNNIIYIVLLIIFIFYFINYYLYYKEHFEVNKNLNIKIIISRYNEDLKWTLEDPFNQYKYIVYNKGDNDNFEKQNVEKIIQLPNVGKCDHTYLYHIIDNYHNLSDITVFLPGSVDLPYKRRIAVKILKEINDRNNAVFISLNENDIKKSYYNLKLDTYRTKHNQNNSKNDEYILKKSLIRPFGLWFENMFGNIKVNCLIYYGVFSIHKEDIIQHPVSRYQTLIKELSDHSNPEVGHYFERSWCAIFHPLKKTDVIKYNKL